MQIQFDKKKPNQPMHCGPWDSTLLKVIKLEQISIHRLLVTISSQPWSGFYQSTFVYLQSFFPQRFSFFTVCLVNYIHEVFFTVCLVNYLHFRCFHMIGTKRKIFEVQVSILLTLFLTGRSMACTSFVCSSSDSDFY